MSLDLSWTDIGIRLVLTVVGCALIGLNREASGHAAGFRTTILVGLAASVAMIQANLLLAAGAKSGGSDLAMDVLRFPLGILTGVGFIGGGAILKRGNLVIGVTTAATIWVVTAIGLAFGGGQLELAGAAVAITLMVLWIFKWANPHIRREHKALLAIKVDDDKGAVPDIKVLVAPLGYTTNFLKLVRNGDGAGSVVTYDIRWRRAETGPPPTDLIAALSKHYPVLSLDAEGDMAGQ